jgi:hypothetical protein
VHAASQAGCCACMCQLFWGLASAYTAPAGSCSYCLTVSRNLVLAACNLCMVCYMAVPCACDVLGMLVR